jgi:hypothetical protein
VRNMYNTLLRRVDIFSTIKPRQILYLLWQIFLDARYFFSLSVEDDEDLPDSTLNVAAQMLERGSIAMDIVGVPEEELLGLASPGMRSEGYSGPSGGFSQMFPPTDRPTDRPTNPRFSTNRGCQPRQIGEPSIADGFQSRHDSLATSSSES